ncbi:MAG: transporter [Pseudomonadota bacterium]
MNRIGMRWVSIAVMTGWMWAVGCTVVWAVGDGPRAYQPVPDGTNIVSLYGLGLRGNQAADFGTVFPDGDLDVNLGLLQYSRAFSVGGAQAAALVIVPYGNSDGSLDFGNTVLSDDVSGFGDLIVGGVVTLIGPPPLSMDEYLAYDPGLVMSLLGKLTLPTGQYDEDRILNMGANRMAFQLGLPTSYYFGESFLDGRLTSVELAPSITFYGDNDEPFGTASETSQDPIFLLEGHLTHNFHQAFWMSLDALYTYGGETSTDGVSDDNTQESFGLGATANLFLSETMSIKLSYGEVVWNNDNGPDGDFVRAVFTVTF